jgi:hypothetical protein
MGRLLPGVAAAPAGHRPAPIQLRTRRVRLTRRGLAFGPLHCAKASKPRCRGRLEVRWNGRGKAFGARRLSLRAGRTSSYAIHVGPRTRRKLRRTSSSGRITVVIRLNRPKAFVRSYPRMTIARRR